jgi:hypothetical protein
LPGALHPVPLCLPCSLGLQFGSSARPKLYREDDWKKAYVTFAPPPGLQLDVTPKPASASEMLRTLREARLGRLDGRGQWVKGGRRQKHGEEWLQPEEVVQYMEEKREAEAASKLDKDKKAGKADPSLDAGADKAASALAAAAAGDAPAPAAPASTAEQAESGQPKPSGDRRV